MSRARRQAPFTEGEANDSPGFLLWQVTALWQRQVSRALRPHDLTQVQFAILASVLWLTRREDDVTQARLAAHARLDVTMTSQVLRTLEARRLLDRRAHPSDTRAKVLRLTAAGRALALKAVPDVEAADAAFFAALGAGGPDFNRRLRALIEGATSD